MYVTPPRIFGKIAACLLGGLISLGSTLLQAAPEAGWWWNPNESGRGFFLEVQGPRMFMSGYFYGEDGRATWLVSNDPMPEANSYDGRLLAFRNGQSLAGDYRHPEAAVDAGAVSLRFSDDRHGTLTWAGGNVAIERYQFQHGGNASFQPKTGWWWNPDESGRGYSIEMQGDHMFIGAYMYDAAGNPVWYVADALMQSPNVFRADLLQFAHGQTLAGAYRAPTPPAVAGTLTVDFSAPNRAEVTLSDDKSAKGRRKSTVVKQYEPMVAIYPPKFWVGGFESTTILDVAGTHYSYNIDVPTMTWQRSTADPGGDLATLDPFPAVYTIASGFAVIKLEISMETCHVTAVVSSEKLQGDLVVWRDGTYEANVIQSVTIPAMLNCKEEDREWQVEFDFGHDFNIVMQGSLSGWNMTGEFPPNPLEEAVQIGSWAFGARD
jgi:hypothetical protein